LKVEAFSDHLAFSDESFRPVVILVSFDRLVILGHIPRVRTVLQKEIDKIFDDFDVLAVAGESSAASPLHAPPQEDSAGTIERRAPDGISSPCGAGDHRGVQI
jgi:hypothetical protein